MNMYQVHLLPRNPPGLRTARERVRRAIQYRKTRRSSQESPGRGGELISKAVAEDSTEEDFIKIHVSRSWIPFSMRVYLSGDWWTLRSVEPWSEEAADA